MDNATASPDPQSTSRRRSGRVVRAPEKFDPEPTQTTKRKRATDGDEEDDEDVENEAPEADDDMSDATDNDVPAVRLPKPRSKAAASKTKKPAVKKPKTNGVADSLEHAASLPSRPKKKVALTHFATPGADDLYSDVFTSSQTTDQVAEAWLRNYQENDARAVRDLVNFVLRSCGCELQITEDDIRDPDNSEARLTELQELYTEEHITEYPLISRAKGTKSFRDLLTDFFVSLVEVLHETEFLYKEEVLVENISRWIASMSTSSLRPFRHTATTAILSLVTGLVGVAETLDNRISGHEQQLRASQRGKNKSKTQESQRNLNQANTYRIQCGDVITDFFDTTFIHRYRDIDPRIRTECAEALGHWILQLPNIFMEPSFLRYLGWMLSDIVASTRQEVLKQLGRILKSNADQLGHFIERFQPRLVEMAAKDAEVSVRVAAIAVVDILRAAGLLEPLEIDAIGRLIFDNEIRVRKAVVNFFDACVDDSIEVKLQELGGNEILDEVFGGVEEDDFESPRKEWINIKCLAELLAAYDAAVEEQQQSSESPDLVSASEIFQAAVPASRITIASQVLYEKLPAVKEWEQLSGYLLYDHTVSSKSKPKSAAKNAEMAVKRAVGPENSEEAILLEVIAASVTMALNQNTEADKGKKKGGRHEATEAQEETALELAAMIPRLLSKFGADASTAKIVLRMEHALKPDVFQQLRQDSSRYEKLLDEISNQFSRHDDKEVLAEATALLSHARQHDDLEELTDSKISLLWENTINDLRNFDKTCELSERGNLSEEHLQDLSSIMSKMSNLASISDCIDVLEAEGQSIDSTSSSIEILSNTVNRGHFSEIDDRIDDLEDEVTSFAIKAAQFYFMWKLHGIERLIRIGASIADSDVTTLQKLLGVFQDHLINTLSSRVLVDNIRLLATGSLCDVHILFSWLRSWIDTSGQGSKYKKLAGMVQEIDPGLTPELVSIFDGIERSYSKKTKKTLNEPADDEDPVDDELSDDDEEDEVLSREQRHVNELKAERSLCELAGKFVMAITRKVLDQSGENEGRLRKRLLRNQTKLGKNYHEVVAYLDDKKRQELLYGKKKGSKAPAKKPAPASTATAAGKQPAQSEEIIVADDNTEDAFEEAEPEEGSREDLRRRELLEEDEEDQREDEQGGEDVENANRSPDADSVLGD